jgi:chromosomal replication initiation ATPase DnaA
VLVKREPHEINRISRRASDALQLSINPVKEDLMKTNKWGAIIEANSNEVNVTTLIPMCTTITNISKERITANKKARRVANQRVITSIVSGGLCSGR